MKNTSFSELLKEWAKNIEQSGDIIIVEGTNDVAALVAVGIPSKRVIALSGRPLYIVVEEVINKAGGNKCIILTDLDKKGRQLYSRLSKDLTAARIKIDNTPRMFLLKETKIRQIEGIINYCE